MKTIIDVVIEKSGGVSSLARKLGLTSPAVTHWKTRGFVTPPIKHAFKIEQITGIPKEEIWPEYFSKEASNEK